MRSALAVVSMVVYGASFAFDRPPVGTDIDERREVALLRSLPPACLSISLGDVAVLAPEERINSLVQAESQSWSTEPERLAAIKAGRARALSSLPRGTADRWGCQTVAAAISQDIKYLLVSEIEEGNVALANFTSGVLQERVEVHYLAARCGPLCGHGDILVRLSDGKVLLAVSWWAS